MTKKLISGNEAIVEGAMASGLGFFAAYPITPASEIMHGIVKKQIPFIQAEDEIGAICMCIGGSLAGAKSMTATSGPGFSLKQEAIGYAFKEAIPMVIVNSQRVGPTTGMPTIGAQGDILQAEHGTHGEYIPLIFYPNSVEECYKYSIEAMNAAEEAQTPVILLSDATLSHMYETVDLSKIKFKIAKRKRKPIGEEKRHFTGLNSKDGLPRSSDAEVYKEWYEGRKKSINDVAKKYNFYEYIDDVKSDTLLIAYGITSRVVLPLKDKYDIFRPIRIFPILEELKEISKKYAKIVVIEMNDGQYKKELEAFLKRDIVSIPLLGGEISLEGIEDGLAKIS